MSQYHYSSYEWYDKVRVYERFDQMPETLHNPSALHTWLEFAPTERFHQIPEPLVTDAMRLTALRSYSGALSWISPTSTPNYLKLVLEALPSDCSLILSVDAECLSEEFLYSAVKTNKLVMFEILRENCDRFNNLISQRIVDEGCRHSPRTLWKMLGEDQWKLPARIVAMVTDEHIAQSARNESNELHYIKRLGKLHVLTDMIKNGYWPQDGDSILKRDDLGTISQYSSRLPSACDAYREARKQANVTNNGYGHLDEAIQTLFEAALKLYPASDVLQWLDRPSIGERNRHIESIKDLYTSDELKPFLREYPFVKAMVLEADLGM